MTTAEPIPARAAPGPRGLPIVGSLPALIGAGGLLQYIGPLWRELGDAFRVRLGRRDMWFFCHPDHVEHILKTRREIYIKGDAFDQVRLLTGDGLLTTDSPDWLRRRRLAASGFHGHSLARLVDRMATTVDSAIDRLRRLHPSGTVVDIHPHMVRLTLEIVGEALFGVSVAEHADASGRAFADALEIVSARGNAPVALPLSIPTPGNRRLKHALAYIHHTVESVIDRAEQAQRAAQAEPTLLSMLMAARDEDGGPGFTRQELHDEVVTMFLAGHETTALAMSWAAQMLGTRSEVWERIREEADARLGTPSFESVRGLTYTRRVVDEILRLRSPVWGTGRTATAADEVGGISVPAGAMVVPTFYFAHRHPEFWDEPERFDPERFTPERVAKRHPFAYAAFGAGPRICVGQGFALIESQLILARLAQSLIPEAVGEVAPNAAATLRPAGPVRIRLRWR